MRLVPEAAEGFRTPKAATMGMTHESLGSTVRQHMLDELRRDLATAEGAALLKAAAQEFSRYGYADADLGRVLERVANEFSSPGSTAGGSSVGAGAHYSRGGQYRLYANKEELALAVVQRAEETWYEQVGHLFADEDDPVGALLAVARGHALYCRQDVPLVVTTLRAEFEGRDHLVGRAVNEALGRFIDNTVRLITAGRRSGAIPPGPPPRQLALAYLGALDWIVRQLRGQEPYDVQLAERAVSGLLGLAPTQDLTHRA